MAKRLKVTGARSISLKELFRMDAESEEGNYFPTYKTKRPKRVAGKGVVGGYTREQRYPLHEAFLKRYKNSIKTFADVGASMPKGALTTIDAKKVLGRNAKVYAVDHPEVIKESEIPHRLKKEQVIPSLHSIIEGPLPFKCDAIRFANVSYWMSQSNRRRAILNIWKSLKPGGYLLGSTEVSTARSLGGVEHQFILRKTERGFEELEVVMP